MIFYFSGTNNSHHVADSLAKILNDKVISIGQANRDQRFDYELAPGERLGFVCPVHAWNLPFIMNVFIPKMNIKGYQGQYVFGVFTCGANDGSCDHDLKSLLKKKGITLNATYAIVMPDNYIPMYDIESPEKQKQVLSEAETLIPTIALHIQNEDHGFKRTKKNPPRIFSSLIGKLAPLGLKTSAAFFVTADCIGCGICEKNCPMRTITMVDGRPVWRGDCTKCLKCIHYCPVKAIQMNDKTSTRGRYHHPDYPKAD